MSLASHRPNHKTDIYLRSDSSTTVPYLTLGDNGVVAALADGAAIQPKDCVELFRTSPFPPGTHIPAQRGSGVLHRDVPDKCP